MAAVRTHLPSVMDAADIPLADLFAEAVLQNVPRDEDAEEAAAELSAVVTLVASTPALDLVFYRAPIAVSAREAIVERAFRDRCSPVIEALLGVLVRRDRLTILPVIARRLRTLLDRRQGKVHVYVTTAAEMDEGLRREVAEAMAKKLSAKPVLHASVNESLVGGMVIRVGGEVYDDSIVTELERMREKLSDRFAKRLSRD